ncbi:glycosyltransferase of family GT4 [Leptolyngbya sp. NIES-3755]|nr:glycosyltransferase of family GT4 [Leptolyngbya sp. NIES-3755]
MTASAISDRGVSTEIAKSLKILVLTNLYPPQVLGGYERSIADFARLLQHRGHQVLVLTSDTPEFFGVHESRYAEPCIDRCFQLLGEWSGETRWFDEETVRDRLHHNVQVLNQQIDAFQPDVCFAGNVDFLTVGVELIDVLLSRKIPIAHYVMNFQPGYPVECSPQRSIYRYITCSDWVIHSLASQGYPTSNVQTIYPGADVEAFYQPELPNRDRLRIAYASLVMPYKGPDVLLEALSILNASGIEFSATIAGGTFQPEFVEALKSFVIAENLQDSIQFTGALSRQQLKDLYKTHNVLVFPSRFEEPFGISQIEAMSAGLTLVTSGTGGAGEIINQHGVDGLLFESENSIELADVLATLAIDSDQWESIARCGQSRAVSEFSQIKAVEQLETVFAELLELNQSGLEAKIHSIGRYSLLLPLDHALDRYQQAWQRYDTSLGYIAQAVFQKYPDASAIDIGANVGDSAALIRNYADIPILCIEGSSSFTPYLEHNAAILDRVEIEACFVGEEDTTLSIEQIHHQSGTATIVKASDSDSKIPIRSLQSILEAYPQFQNAKLLKSDTDGFDFSILKSSIALLSSMLPVLHFEYDITFHKNAEVDAIDTLKNLAEIGYERFLVYDNFGNYLIGLSSCDVEKFRDLTAYLVSNRRVSGTPAVYYFDVCAFGAADIDVFETVRQLELDVFDRSRG